MFEECQRHYQRGIELPRASLRPIDRTTIIAISWAILTTTERAMPTYRITITANSTLNSLLSLAVLTSLCIVDLLIVREACVAKSISPVQRSLAGARLSRSMLNTSRRSTYWYLQQSRKASSRQYHALLIGPFAHRVLQRLRSDTFNWAVVKRTSMAIIVLPHPTPRRTTPVTDPGTSLSTPPLLFAKSPRLTGRHLGARSIQFARLTWRCFHLIRPGRQTIR